ncbi:hypothetical protein RUM44_007335 [Polyplax serrata]|uniref:Cytochrome b5 domain-containing protein 1 n=1 Tax=Polyplax serrata TaxID=468196 RepID=A0ABR1B0V4_POLSC
MGQKKDENTKEEKKSESGLRYYLPTDVVLHNKPNDIWVSFLGKVCNITPLVKEYKGRRELKPLLAYAGKDISHWFDKRTQDIKFVVHPVTGIKVPYCPHGPIPHVHPQVPSSTWQSIEGVMKPYDGLPWWKDKKYVIGLLSTSPRPVRIINTAIPQSHRHSLAWVAAEENLYQILQRLLPRNSHLTSYTFKFEGENLKMNKTLEENDVPDERLKFSQLGMRDNCYIPAIQLHYNDNLTK